MSGLLLDTHVFLWWMMDAPELGAEARAAIASVENLVAVSAATAWEIAIKRALGKLEAPTGLEAAITSCGFELLPITVEHAEAAGGLPRLHDDPFARMLVAQAQLEGLTLVTRDGPVASYDVSILRA